MHTQEITANGLRFAYLEMGEGPLVLLLHGFPELAFSWRKVMPVLAEAGYHVIAPDQRGYGRTTGWDQAYEGGLGAFRLPNLVRDALGADIAIETPMVEPLADVVLQRALAIARGAR